MSLVQHHLVDVSLYLFIFYTGIFLFEYSPILLVIKDRQPTGQKEVKYVSN